jgi:hypothetical protein
MTRGEFFKAVSDLSDWVENLCQETEAVGRVVEDDLYCQQQFVLNPPLNAVLIMIGLDTIAERLEKAMAAHNRLSQLADVMPRYELALQLLDSSPSMERKVRQIVKRKNARRRTRPPDDGAHAGHG